MSGDGYNLYWHVPIDDTHHWRYDIVFAAAHRWMKRHSEKPRNSRRAYGRPQTDSQQVQPLSARSRIDEELELLRHGTNLQRSGYRHRRGLRCDRGPHPGVLGPADKAIIAARRMVLRAIRDLDAGREPPHVIRRAENRFPHLMIVSEVITDGSDWKSYWKNRLAAINEQGK